MRELHNRFSFDRTRHLVSVDGEPNGSPTAFGKEAMTMLHATIDNPFPLEDWEVRSFMVRAFGSSRDLRRCGTDVTATAA